MSGRHPEISGRVPPYDATAERACLGAVLLNNGALPIIRSTIVDAADFYVEAHRKIYESMVRLTGEGTALDHVTVGNWLNDHGELERIGGPIALENLTESVATVANVQHYARIVRDHAAVRRMIYAAQQVVSDGFGGVEDVPEYLAGARKMVTVASAVGGNRSGPVQIGENLAEVFNQLESGKMPEGLVPTGVEPVDELTGGLWPGLLHVIGARPSMGKSALCLNIVTNCALSGRPALYIPTEDETQYIQLRELARFGDVDLNDLMLRTVHKDDWRKLAAGGAKIRDLPLWVDDSPGLSSERIGQIAALHKQVHGLDLLVVDHLGELRDKGETQTAVVEAAARGLRDIAKELKIPVLLAVQLNREVERRPDKRPTLHDLRQSGSIEQIARVVWFMYRRGYYVQGCEDDPDTQLIVGKATHGKTGTIRLWSDLSRMYIRGWNLETDGVFPEDGAGKYTAPPRREGDPVPEDRQRRFFEGTGPASRAERGKHWSDDY
jgi:replicative DNA helicase